MTMMTVNHDDDDDRDVTDDGNDQSEEDMCIHTSQ